MDGAVQESDPIPVYLERIKDLMVGLSLPLPDLSHIEEKMAQKSAAKRARSPSPSSIVKTKKSRTSEERDLLIGSGKAPRDQASKVETLRKDTSTLTRSERVTADRDREKTTPPRPQISGKVGGLNGRSKEVAKEVKEKERSRDGDRDRDREKGSSTSHFKDTYRTVSPDTASRERDRDRDRDRERDRGRERDSRDKDRERDRDDWRWRDRDTYKTPGLEEDQRDRERRQGATRDSATSRDRDDRDRQRQKLDRYQPGEDNERKVTTPKDEGRRGREEDRPRSPNDNSKEPKSENRGAKKESLMFTLRVSTSAQTTKPSPVARTASPNPTSTLGLDGEARSEHRNPIEQEVEELQKIASSYKHKGDSQKDKNIGLYLRHYLKATSYYFKCCYQLESKKPPNWFPRLYNLYLTVRKMLHGAYILTLERNKDSSLNSQLALLCKCKAVLYAKEYMLALNGCKRMLSSRQTIVEKVHDWSELIKLTDNKEVTKMIQTMPSSVSHVNEEWKRSQEMMPEGMEDFSFLNIYSCKLLEFVTYLESQVK